MPQKFIVLQKEDGSYAVYRYNSLSQEYQLHFPRNGGALNQIEAEEYCATCNRLAEVENEIPDDNQFQSKIEEKKVENEVPADDNQFQPKAEEKIRKDEGRGLGSLIVGTIVIVTIIIAVAGSLKKLSGSENYSPSTYSRQSSEINNRYKSFGDAINDGSIEYGMTYKQISKICGPADDVIKHDGQVSHVRYGSVGTVYEVEFRNGRMWTYGEYQW